MTASARLTSFDPPLRRRRLAAAALLALAAAGCGSRDDELEAQAQRGSLQASEPVATLAKTQIDAVAVAAGAQPLAGAAACDVSIRQIVYSSIAPDDSASPVSAALLIPGGAGCTGPFTLVAYAHATSRDRSRTLATPEDPETQLLTSMFAAQGYIVVATDYLGYGKSAFAYHPYLDTKTEAASVIDSIRAARTVLTQLQIPLNGRVLLAGYSQGGHSALAAQRAIEAGGAADIVVSGTGAMSGPYDLNLTFQQGLRVLPGVGNGGDGSAPSSGATFVLGSAIADALGDFATTGALADALRAQSVTGWAATAPVLLCGGTRDTTVSFANAAAAATDLRARGAPVTIVDVDSDPAYASLVPAAGTPSGALDGYHSRTVPPLCFQAVRDRLFVNYR